MHYGISLACFLLFLVDLVGEDELQVGSMCAQAICPEFGLIIGTLEAASVVSRSHIKRRLMCSGIKPYMLYSARISLVGCTPMYPSITFSKSLY